MRLSLFIVFLVPLLAFGADTDVSLVIRNHAFEPLEVRIPARQKVRLIVQNLDSTPEEFESFELNREKVIPGGATASIFIGPLTPGRYPFFGEFHEKTAHGTVIVE